MNFRNLLRNCICKLREIFHILVSLYRVINCLIQKIQRTDESTNPTHLSALIFIV